MSGYEYPASNLSHLMCLVGCGVINMSHAMRVRYLNEC